MISFHYWLRVRRLDLRTSQNDGAAAPRVSMVLIADLQLSSPVGGREPFDGSEVAIAGHQSGTYR